MYKCNSTWIHKELQGTPRRNTNMLLGEVREDFSSNRMTKLNPQGIRLKMGW